MTRKKSTRETATTLHDEQDPAGWIREPAPEIIRDQDDAEMDEVFSDFPQNEACIQLFRVNAQGGRPMFLEQLSPAMFSLAYVTERYGGGRYQAKGRYKDGSKVRMPFEIEGEPFPVRRILPGHNAPPSPLEPVTPRQGAPSLEYLTPPGGDLQTVLLGLMKNLIQEMRGSETQMLEKMKLYKELFAPPQQKDAPLDQALSMLKQGIELGSSSGGGEGPNLWLLALDKLKEPLTKIVDTIQVAVTQPRPIAVNPASAPAPAAVPVAPVTQQEDDMLMLLKMVLPSLVNGAAKNADPLVYVDFLLDQVPESAYPKLQEWLERPDCLDKLAAIEPGIRFQQEWWVALRGQLIAALRGDDGAGSIQSEPSGIPSTGGTTDLQDPA